VALSSSLPFQLHIIIAGFVAGAILGCRAWTLIVGDDDQVLYETLKSGKASLIRAIYSSTDVVNAMLPFCGRCDFHITRTASHFMKQEADEECIEKIYLPMTEAGASKKVQVIGCAQPSTAVDYIRKFIDNHKEDIEQRRKDLAEGKSKDAFLLILSPLVLGHQRRCRRSRRECCRGHQYCLQHRYDAQDRSRLLPPGRRSCRFVGVRPRGGASRRACASPELPLRCGC
jgi:hypothetical protein